MHHADESTAAVRSPARVWRAALAAALAGLLAGCGGGGGNGSSAAPPPPAISTATVVISSTANGHLISYGAELQSITLTNAAGNSVTLMSSAQAQGREFIHVNGTIEPLLTVTIPQDTYTSAAATLSGTAVSCLGINSSTGLLEGSGNAGSATPTATVTLPQPLVVNSPTVGLMLTLLVSQSASVDCGQDDAFQTAKTNPAFTLTSFAIASEPDSPMNGAVDALQGQVTNVDGNTLQIMLPLNYASPEMSAGALTVTADAATVWDGVASAQQLAVGQFVIVDGALQADGSVRATRVTLPDPNAVDVQSGQLQFAALPGQLNSVDQGTYPAFGLSQNQQQGTDSYTFYNNYETTATSVFSMSSAATNLSSLPFTPSFVAANLVVGQNVYVSSQAYSLAHANIFTTVNTVTQLPQTIDALISSVATSGNFTVYTVTRPSDDAFVLLAGSGPQQVPLAQPATVMVYVDASTKMLASQAPAVGGSLRFYGLLFNDAGTLRMDCTRILDGA